MQIGELKSNEPHPMARDAMAFVKEWMAKQTIQSFAMLREAMASCAIEGNRVGEVCGATLDRLLKSEPVSDRYLLGLAWFIRNFEEQKDK